MAAKASPGLRAIAVSTTKRVCIVMGTAPMGMANQPETRVRAANKDTRISLLLFILYLSFDDLHLTEAKNISLFIIILNDEGTVVVDIDGKGFF